MRYIEVTDSGRYRLNFKDSNNKRLYPESFDTLAETRRRRDIILRERVVHLDPNAVTVEQWSKLWVGELPKRLSVEAEDRKKLKDLPNVRSRLKHILASDLAKMPLILVTENDAKEFVKWLAKRLTQRLVGKEKTRAKGKRKRTKPITQNPLGTETRRRTITVLRWLFQDAIDDPKNRCKCRGRANPITDKIKVAGERTKPIEKDVPLYPEDQDQLIAAMGQMLERFIIIIAIWTGLRRGELWNLERCDVHLDKAVPGKPGETRCYIEVKYGGRDHAPPKNGKTRIVDLMGLGLYAMRQWLACLDEYAPHNPYNLVFPTPRRLGPNGNWFKGGCRRAGKPDWFIELQHNEVLGKEKRFWWHALRHTCATGLLNGWFGRRWLIDEVAEFLGHSSSEITRIYAKVTQDTMRAAATETNVGWLARTQPESTPAPPPPPPPAPQPAEGSLRGGIADLIAQAVREGNMTVAQALMSAAGATSTATAPLTHVAPAQVPVPSPIPIPQPAPAVVPVEPALINVSRTGRRVSRSSRASRVSPSGDTEGPRRCESAHQLTPSKSASTSPDQPLGFGSSAPAGRAGLSPESIVLTLAAQGLNDHARPESGTNPVTTAMQPKRRAAGQADGGLVTVPANEKPNPVTTTLAQGIDPSTLRLPDFGAPPQIRPRTVQSPGLTEQYHTLNSTPLRSTEPKVEGSNPSGRAEQLPVLSSESGPTLGRPLDGPDRRADESGVDIGSTESDATGAPAPLPAWFSALEAVNTDREPESVRPRSPSTPTAVPALPTPEAPPPAPVAPVTPLDAEPEASAPEPDASHVAKASWLMREIAKGLPSATKAAEDLAMGLLLDSGEQHFHETARLILKDTALALPRAAQLAIRLTSNAAVSGGQTPKRDSRKNGRGVWTNPKPTALTQSWPQPINGPKRR